MIAIFICIFMKVYLLYLLFISGIYYRCFAFFYTMLNYYTFIVHHQLLESSSLFLGKCPFYVGDGHFAASLIIVIVPFVVFQINILELCI